MTRADDGSQIGSGIIRTFFFAESLTLRFTQFSNSGSIAKTVLALMITGLSPFSSGTTDAIGAIDALSPVVSVRLNASVESAMVPSAVIASLDGRPTVAATQTVGVKTTIYLVRALANGAVDASFGTAGRAAIAETSRCVGKLLLDNDGADTIVVAEMGADPGWIYEGVVFYVYPFDIRAEGCTFWQSPVRRLYNDRAAQNDSNHRYVVDAAQAAITAATGYTEEGFAFCAPL